MMAGERENSGHIPCRTFLLCGSCWSSETLKGKARKKVIAVVVRARRGRQRCKRERVDSRSKTPRREKE